MEFDRYTMEMLYPIAVSAIGVLLQIIIWTMGLGASSRKIEQEKELLEEQDAFKSQFFDPTSNEPETPISSKQFIETIKNRSNELGKYIGVAHAEGFTVERYMGANNLFDLL